MGYRIDFTVGDGVLKAVVSGKSSKYVDAIARDIGEQARKNSVRQVLIDVRRLHDRDGQLRSLLASEDLPKRVAVVDTWEHDRYYIFAELAARRLGCDLRRFDSQAAALSWLHSPQD